MRWDSPPVLVVVGTVAVHTLLLTAGDAIATFERFHVEPAPRFELFEIAEPEPPPPPPPPPAAAPPAPAPPATPPPTAPRAPRVATPARIQAAPPPAPEPPPTTPPTTTSDAPPGGAPVYHMPDIAPAARGVPVARGPAGGPVGAGGSGSGAGSGARSGAGSAAAAPLSIATIKTRALPRGDYSYFGAGKDYPAEAKALGIDGVVKVRLVVDATGKVTSATPLGHLGHGLDELADRYAHAIVFDPARDGNDQPVPSVVVWTFQFTLPK